MGRIDTKVETIREDRITLMRSLHDYRTADDDDALEHGPASEVVEAIALDVIMICALDVRVDEALRRIIDDARVLLARSARQVIKPGPVFDPVTRKKVKK